MISAMLVANTTGSPAFRPASVSFVMLPRSAEANTSAGAPSPICVTSSDDAAKFSTTSASGFSTMNASPISVNAAASDAAAKTVMSPSAAGAVDDGRVRAGSVVSAVVAGVELESSDPHAATVRPMTAQAAIRRRAVRRTPATIVTGRLFERHPLTIAEPAATARPIEPPDANEPPAVQGVQRGRGGT